MTFSKSGRWESQRCQDSSISPVNLSFPQIFLKRLFENLVRQKNKGRNQTYRIERSGQQLATAIFVSSLNFQMVEYHLKMKKLVPGSDWIPKEDVLLLSSNESSSFSVAGARSSSGILFRSSEELVAHLWILKWAVPNNLVKPLYMAKASLTESPPVVISSMKVSRRMVSQTSSSRDERFACHLLLAMSLWKHEIT